MCPYAHAHIHNRHNTICKVTFFFYNLHTCEQLICPESKWVWIHGGMWPHLLWDMIFSAGPIAAHWRLKSSLSEESLCAKVLWSRWNEVHLLNCCPNGFCKSSMNATVKITFKGIWHQTYSNTTSLHTAGIQCTSITERLEDTQLEQCFLDAPNASKF